MDHSLGKTHTVGQLEHNVHKVMRVLEKSNYLKMNRMPQYQGQEKEAAKAPLFKKIHEGDSDTIGVILRYLIFDSSSAMISFLKANKVNLEMKYLIDSKFIKCLSKVYMELFKYRVQLAPE